MTSKCLSVCFPSVLSFVRQPACLSSFHYICMLPPQQFDTRLPRARRYETTTHQAQAASQDARWTCSLPLAALFRADGRASVPARPYNRLPRPPVYPRRSRDRERAHRGTLLDGKSLVISCMSPLFGACLHYSVACLRATRYSTTEDYMDTTWILLLVDSSCLLEYIDYREQPQF